MMTKMHYFDYNASKPLLAEARAAMLQALDAGFGNPSSIHQPGRLARNALDDARAQVAALVNVHASQVIFTGGGTEANNLALRGVMERNAGAQRRRLLVGATEHSAVLQPALALSRHGIQCDIIPVNQDGVIDIEAFAQMLDDDVLLVSVMAANNETGVLQDIPALARLCRQHGIILHTDAIQLLGKAPVDFNALGAQLLTVSAHKLGGPTGTGALIVDGSVAFEPQVRGGGQEHGYRGGTENLPGIAGFAAAATEAAGHLSERNRICELRNAFERQLQQWPGCRIFGNRVARLDNTSFFAIAGIDGAALQMALDKRGFAVATGSACHSGSGKPSHVLTAMGVDADIARGAIRVSLGETHRKTDIDELLAAIDAIRQELSHATGATGW